MTVRMCLGGKVDFLTAPILCQWGPSAYQKIYYHFWFGLYNLRQRQEPTFPGVALVPSFAPRIQLEWPIGKLGSILDRWGKFEYGILEEKF